MLFVTLDKVTLPCSFSASEHPLHLLFQRLNNHYISGGVLSSLSLTFITFHGPIQPLFVDYANHPLQLAPAMTESVQ